MSTPPVIRTLGLTREFAMGSTTVRALRGVDLVIARGEYVAIMGPSGSGKSTLMNLIGCLDTPTDGEYWLNGEPVADLSPDQLARIGLCTIPEGRGVFRNLTVRENLKMATYSGTPEEVVVERAVARFPRLGERIDQLAGTMSGGEQQMLAMARGLATDPALLIIDELSMGLAPLIVAELYEIVAGIARDGVSILVVEQFARTVLGVADRAVIMQHGHVISSGSPADLEAELSAAYLGAKQ